VWLKPETIDVKEMAFLGPAIEYGVILYALRALACSFGQIMRRPRGLTDLHQGIL
jgi:hypothetical protein